MVQLFLPHVPESIVTKKDGTGYTPLHIAVFSNEQRLAEMFLTLYPSSADIRDRDGFSPFHLVVRLNETEMFRLFLRHCPNCCTTLTNKGQNALHIAVERNIEGLISVIIKDRRLCELMINQQDENGNTPLHLVVRLNETEMYMVQILQHVPESIVTMKNLAGNTPLHIAVLRNEPRLAEMFLTTHPSSADILDTDGFSPFHLAVRLSQTEMFQLFLRHCPDCCMTLTNKGQNALHIVVERKIQDLISVIIKDKRLSELINQQDENGYTPLHLAVSLNETEMYMVQIFLQHVSESIVTMKDRKGNTPLHIVVLRNEPRLAEMFLTTHPSSADILDRDGFSPFHLAVRLNETEMFLLFLRHCPNCCMTHTDKGQNVLHIAVERNIEGLISNIINEKRPNEPKNQQDKKGNTPLSEDKRLSKLINQQDENGNTPLHLAAYRDDKKMQDTLLGCQAKVLPLRNNDGLTFEDVAKSCKERKQKEKKEKMQIKLVKSMEDFQSSLLVMATLIITVTFTAAFTLPGGYNSDQPNKGMATLAGRAGFVVFMVMDTMSMCSSIVATAALVLFSLVFSTEKRFNTLKVAIGAIAISIIFMLAAFTAGVWLVIGSHHRWLAIFIAVITACTPLCLVLLAAHIMLGSGIEEVIDLLMNKS